MRIRSVLNSLRARRSSPTEDVPQYETPHVPTGEPPTGICGGAILAKGGATVGRPPVHGRINAHGRLMPA